MRKPKSKPKCYDNRWRNLSGYKSESLTLNEWSQAQIIEQVQPAIAHVEWAIRACLVCIDLGQSRNVARQSLTRFKRLQCLNVRSRTGNREYDHLRFVLLDRAGGMVNNSWLRLNDCCYLGKFGRLWSLVLTLELRTLVVNTEANPLKKKHSICRTVNCSMKMNDLIYSNFQYSLWLSFLCL
jgi:hypothetical protein